MADRAVVDLAAAAETAGKTAWYTCLVELSHKPLKPLLMHKNMQIYRLLVVFALAGPGANVLYWLDREIWRCAEPKLSV